MPLDLESFRFEEQQVASINFTEGFAQFKAKEAHYLTQFDGLIVHSNEMAQAVRDNFAFTGPLVVQGPWGYYTEKVPAPKDKTATLLFAGSAGKAGYLKDLCHALNTDFSVLAAFNLTPGPEAPNFDGSWIHEPLRPNIQIQDKHYDASYVDQLLHAGFGLVWDSASYPDVTGGFGQYMHMAMPHKFSMYTVAGIPSIVWSHSCIAPLITESQMGWTIESLNELDELIANVSPEEYRQRTENLDKFSDLIRSGYHTKQAVLNMVGLLHGEPYAPPHSDYHVAIGYADQR